MARFSINQLDALAARIEASETIVNRAASLAINRTLTYAKDESVGYILREVNLQRTYVRRNLRTVKRASPRDLSGIIRANTRETLLTRYPHQQGRDGVRVAVNARGGFKVIESAFVVRNLRFSGATGIALRNAVRRNGRLVFPAVEALRADLSPATPGKRRKLQRLIQAARTNPRGIQVLHSRSINQLFTTAREVIEPRVQLRLAEEFTRDLMRLSR